MEKPHNAVIDEFIARNALPRDSHQTRTLRRRPVKQWTESNVSDWARALSTSTASEPTSLAEIIGVVARGVYLASSPTCRKKPRQVQLLAILAMLSPKLKLSKEERGRILQVATGQGKSIIISMAAVIHALRGMFVDEVTSSLLLAQRDAADPEKVDLYKLFHFTVNHNTETWLSRDSGAQSCYRANIVYGDLHSFQGDQLAHEFHAYGTHGERSHHAVIVDEVDSMLVDESVAERILMLSFSTPGMEYLEHLKITGWLKLQALSDRIVYDASSGGRYLLLPVTGHGPPLVLDVPKVEFCRRELKRAFRRMLGVPARDGSVDVAEDGGRDVLRVDVPIRLRDYAIGQIAKWTKSAVAAAFSCHENVDYVVKVGKDGHKRIEPVDSENTGVVQESMHLSDGLHEFLQMKHSMKLRPETLVTCFLSNKAYFKRYGSNVYGLTGTLGTQRARDFLRHEYGVDLYEIPTHQPMRLREEPGQLLADGTEWLSAILDSARQEMAAGRALLIINSTIKDALDVRQALLSARVAPPSKIRNYTRSDKKDEKEAVEKVVLPGDFIIATNLAGRGTDFRTSELLDTNGGLHVILTFMPSNLRVYRQGVGRTGRQGKPGSAQMIIHREQFFDDVRRQATSVAVLERFRDDQEEAELDEYQRLFMAAMPVGLGVGKFSLFGLCWRKINVTERCEK